MHSTTAPGAPPLARRPATLAAAAEPGDVPADLVTSVGSAARPPRPEGAYPKALPAGPTEPTETSTAPQQAAEGRSRPCPAVVAAVVAGHRSGSDVLCTDTITDTTVSAHVGSRPPIRPFARPRQDAWEARLRNRPDPATPFVVIMDYALGMTAAARDPLPGEREVLVAAPVVWMAGLALYQAACAANVDRVEQTPLSAAVSLLLSDRSARRVARLQPGHTQRRRGRLRSADRQKLRTALRPGGPWRRWRDTALDVLFYHQWCARKVGQDLVLGELLECVRDAGVRRNWYTYPALAPLLAPGEAGVRR